MPKLTLHAVMAVGILLMALTYNAKAFTPDTEVIRQQQDHHRYTQTKVGDCETLPLILHWGVSDLQYKDGDLTVKGTDKLGRRYSFTKGTGLPGCSIWQADLGGTGSMDLEILVGGSDSSGGYDNSLTLLMFDANGRPFPWQAVGKFTTDAKGIRQIVTDSSAKNARVIVPTKEGLNGPEANLAFELYTVLPGRILKEEGSFLGMKWPAMDNPSEALIKHRKASSLTFDLAANVPTSSLNGNALPLTSGFPSLSLSNGTSVEPPAVLVKDSADGSRVITADPMLEDLNVLIKEKANVQTFGRSCEEEECRPMVLLATP